jgi:hypothetical protein
MSFLKDCNKDSEVVLLSDLPDNLILCDPRGNENRRSEYKQIMTDVLLDYTVDRYENFCP